MKLTDYRISCYDHKDVRHIVSKNKALCGHKTGHTLHGDLENNTYGISLLSLCSICIGKLPKGIGEEIKFNYIVRKLKNDI